MKKRVLDEIASLDDTTAVKEVIEAAKKRLKELKEGAEAKRIEATLAHRSLTCSLKRCTFKDSSIRVTAFPIVAQFEIYGIEKYSNPEFGAIYDECEFALRNIQCQCVSKVNENPQNSQWEPIPGTWSLTEDVRDANTELMITEHWIYWKPQVPAEGEKQVQVVLGQLNNGAFEACDEYALEYPQNLTEVPLLCKNQSQR